MLDSKEPTAHPIGSFSMHKVTVVLCSPLGSTTRILFCLPRTYSQDLGTSSDASTLTSTREVKVSLPTKAAGGKELQRKRGVNLLGIERVQIRRD